MEKDLLHLPATVVAVSKNRSTDDIRRLYAKGFRIFGENRVQELLSKADLDLDISWHMIGHLQTNKVKYVVRCCTLIQSVDSLRLLQEIDKQAGRLNKVMDVLIQINIAQEDTKFGIPETELFPLLKAAESYRNVMIKGIMVIGPHTEDQAQIKKVFTRGRQLFDQLHKIEQTNVQAQYLSMGMSSDYAIALECGSNMVRIGTLLFTTY